MKLVFDSFGDSSLAEPNYIVMTRIRTLTLASIYLCCLVACLAACKKSNQLVLQKVDKLPSSAQIKYNFNNNIFLSEFRNEGFLGEFNMTYFISRTKGKDTVTYKILTQDCVDIYHSQLIVMDMSKRDEYGWFFIQGKIKQDTLPGHTQIMRALKTGSNFVSISKQGSIIISNKPNGGTTEYNYAHFYAKKSANSLDALPLGLYELKDQQLVLLSNKLPLYSALVDGTYYVPYPGRGVLFAVTIAELVNKLNTQSIQQLPGNIKFE
ncbi:hypothetical protein LX64_01963 [Chitinophaga skermanii]|uniref:Uncharacterized protein n=1 Tax=Chitinophaga skermanii TaxID=331697 RepID=A0A327QQH4_9BACT|nr:hypothetical protein [Chitinophaga skermanii]RAJ06836.1 hypothetical protein LX64_01963 [Chitinophaga skermanii]